MLFYDTVLKSKSFLTATLVLSLLAPEFSARAQSTIGVNLGSAANFAILSKSGITNVPPSYVTGGNVGSSPITGAAILISCQEVSGTIYEVDSGGRSCFMTDQARLVAAVSDMEQAYLDAAGRKNATEMGAELGGFDLAPGVYSLSASAVTISEDLVLTGTANDVWIFQIAGNLFLANGKKVILTGGALAKNVFWQVAGSGATIGTTAVMQGNILSKTLIALNTNAVLNGRAFAQTAVTLQMNTITSPTSLSSGVLYSKRSAINLGTANGFAILSKSGITDVPSSYVTGGNVGSSPITGAAILIGCPEVVGKIYQVDAGGPACFVTDPAFLTRAVLDMQAAYVEAAGVTYPDATELGGGEIGGRTLSAGVYKWSSGVTISSDLTLNGSATDVWIFQIAGTLNLANNRRIILSGGALAKNVFWQVAGSGATIGTTAVMEGTILSQTLIALNTNAVLNGRALAQTAVTLQMNRVALSSDSIFQQGVQNLTSGYSAISSGLLVMLGSALALFL